MILVLFLLLRVVQSGEVSNQNQESDKVWNLLVLRFLNDNETKTEI